MFPNEIDDKYEYTGEEYLHGNVGKYRMNFNGISDTMYISFAESNLNVRFEIEADGKLVEYIINYQDDKNTIFKFPTQLKFYEINTLIVKIFVLHNKKTMVNIFIEKQSLRANKFPNPIDNDKYEYTGSELLKLPMKFKGNFTCVSNKLFIEFSKPIPNIKFEIVFNGKIMNNWELVQSNMKQHWIEFDFLLNFNIIKSIIIKITSIDCNLDDDTLVSIFLEKNDIYN